MNNKSSTSFFITLALSILLIGSTVESKVDNKRQNNHNRNNQKNGKRFMNRTSQQQYTPTIQRTPKIIIWDLGGTLFKTDKMGIASHIGLSDFICYPLFDGKSPQSIQDKVFDVLEGLQTNQQHAKSLGANSPDGRVLPAVMCDWLAGKEKGESISKRAQEYINCLEAQNKFYFSSNREKRLVQNTIDAMFDPTVLAKNTKIIKPGLRLLENCYRQKDASGRPLHRMLVLSNWDSISFDNLYNSHQGEKVFKYFNERDIIISGDIKLIKPDNALFNYMIRTYKLNPKDCIFIDDQIENCNAAKMAGMDVLLLENSNYGKLKRQLEDRGVF